MSFVRDTWGRAEPAGYWRIERSDVREPGNQWAAATASRSLEAFAGLVAPLSIQFSTIAADVPMVALDREGQSNTAFTAAIVEAIRSYPAPIYAVELYVETIAYVCTEASPDVPVRMAMELDDFFRIAPPGASREEAHASFTLEHTLFSRHNYEGDNRLLHMLNQPALETALRAWEQAVGPIVEWSGAEGIYRYGFLEGTR